MTPHISICDIQIHDGKGKKVKLFCAQLIKHYAMKGYRGVYVQIHILFTSALVEGEWSASPPGENAPGTNWIGDLVGLRAGLDDVEKLFHPTWTRTPNPRSSSS
jgi:hypothetical protein